MAVDNLANALGNPGKFQVILFLMLCCNSWFICWNHLAMAFMGAKTKHHCTVANQTSIPDLVPKINKGGKIELDGCHLFAGYNTTEKVSCNRGWTYLNEREHTIVSQWDLVCDDKYKTSLASTVYFCGVLLGGLVFGTLSDKFGRKPVLIVTLYSPCVIGLLIFFVQNYVAFVILRFILGFVLQGLQAAVYITIIELFALKYRSKVGPIFTSYWGIGVIFLSLIAYVIQDWRYIQLFITMTTVFQIGLLWFLPESFRWLLAQQKFEMAEKIVHRIAKFNKIVFPRDTFDGIVEDINQSKTSKPERKYTTVDLFRFTVLRKRSIILSWVWFSASLGYYGIALNISSLAGNKYLNFFIGGVLELVAYVMAIFIVERFGRRKPLFIYLMIGSLMGISAGVLSDKGDSDLQALTTALAIIGKLGCAGAFSVLFIYSAELFPTEIRTVGLGTCASFARLAGVIAPQVFLLGKHTTRSVPFIVFGCCAFMASLVSLLLPETLNKNLVDTIEEAAWLEKKAHVDCVTVPLTNLEPAVDDGSLK